MRWYIHSRAAQQTLSQQEDVDTNSEEKIHNQKVKQKDRAKEKLKAASKDEFLQSITATSGPAALYKENRLSGAYKKVKVLSG